MIKDCDLKEIDTSRYKDKILELKDKINRIKDINPKIKIVETLINNNKINVVQEGFLLAGTKQRVAELFVKKLIENEKKDNNKTIDTILYVGTFNGFGAVAVAFAAYRLNISSRIYLSSVPTGFNKEETTEKILESRQILTSLALDAKIYLCNNYVDARNQMYTELNRNKNFYRISMGLNDDKKIMVNLLAEQIKKAIKETKLQTIENPRIWMVAGSGGILMSLNKALRGFTIFVFLTGGGRYIKNVIKFIKNKNKYNKIIILNNNEKKEYENNYYDSVYKYDDNIIPYIEKYGKKDDFIWNVASDKLSIFDLNMFT